MCRDQVPVFNWSGDRFYFLTGDEGQRKEFEKKKELSQQVSIKMEKYRSTFVLSYDGLERRRKLINRMEEEKEQSKDLAKDRASSGSEK